MSDESVKRTAKKETSLIAAQLFSELKYQTVIADLITKRQYSKDKALEQEVAKAFVERAEAGVGEHTLYMASNSEMDVHALSFMGLHHSGESIIEDPDFIEYMLPVFLDKTIGNNSSFVNEQVSSALLDYAYRQDDSKYSEQVRKHLDPLVNKESVSRLIKMSNDGQFDSPLNSEEMDSLANSFGIEVQSIEPPSSEKPKLSTRAIQPDVGELASRVDNDALKHRLDVDLQTSAQMEINRMMDDNPSWVHRTIIHKLKDRISNGLTDLTNPSSLAYPSESIFSRGLSEVDDNGRVVRELLHFKMNPFKGETCVFPSSKVSETVYALAAEYVKKSGIKYPHITTNHKNPQEAIYFMKSSVQALVDSGYDIDDISVGRNVSNAFEKMKADGLFAQHAISEAPDDLRPDLDEAPEEGRKPMPEEVLAGEKEVLHESVNYIKDGLNSDENPMKMSDMPNEKLVNVLGLHHILSQSSNNWNDSVREYGISPAGRDTVEQVKEYFDGLVEKCASEPGKVGKRQAETLYEARKVLPEFYDPDQLVSVKEILHQYIKPVSVEPPAEAPEGPQAEVNAEQAELENGSVDEPHSAPPLESVAEEPTPFENDIPDVGVDPEYAGNESDLGFSPDDDAPPSYLNDVPMDNGENIPPDLEDHDYDVGFDGNQGPVEDSYKADTPTVNEEPKFVDGDNPTATEEPKSVDGDVPGEFDVMDIATDHQEPPPEVPSDNLEESWDNDFASFDQSNGEWSSICDKSWDQLSDSEVYLISNLSPADKVELSHLSQDKMEGLNLTDKQAGQLSLNVRQVETIMSADKEMLQDLSESEVELLSKIPDEMLSNDQKEFLGAQMGVDSKEDLSVSPDAGIRR